MVSTKNTILLALTYWILLPTSGFAKNHLSGETSPHLLEHAESLVDWHPWGENAFEKARSEKKPIFVSIGYHSCHWCHRMLAESFNDPTTAEILNENFINIKVDREEFPNIDRIYMTYVQASQGSGGWPLNVWLTPDLIPFSVGTYFPAKDGSQQPSFTKVIKHLVDQWRRFPDYIDSQSRRDFSRLRTNIQDLPPADPIVSAESQTHFLASYERLSSEFDPQHGGFGTIPRFPSPSKIGTAALILSREKSGSFRGKQCLKMIELTLTKMANGGIHDQIGGGFHRYASDSSWAVPHYEKMLLDQALLLDAYLTAYQLTENTYYREVASSIEAYVTDSLSSPKNGFYSSQHSDSPNATSDKLADQEGAYYIWNAEDFSTATGADSALLSSYYGVRPEGNSPLDRATIGTEGSNTLRVTSSIDELAQKFKLTTVEATTAIARGKSNLRTARQQRTAPKINEQTITSTNALMISALTKAYTVIGSTSSLKRAVTAMEFIKSNCYDNDGTLYRLPKSDKNKHLAKAGDYTFTIEACLNLYTANLDQQWLLLADELQKAQNKFFYDKKGGGFFNTRRARTDVIVRLKSFEDGAELSPNGGAVLNLARLGYLLDDQNYLLLAQQSIDYFRGAIDLSPTLSWRYLLAESMLATPPPQIVITGDRENADTLALLAVAQKRFAPGQILLQIDPTKQDNPIVSRNPRLAAFQKSGTEALAHICRDFSCKTPTSDPATMRSQLIGH